MSSAPGHDIDLVRVIGALSSARTLDELQRAFVSGFPRVLDAPMYGYYLDGRARSVAVNVSDAFIATYVRNARQVDPVLARALSTRRPAYNRQLMTAREWEATEVYRRAYRIHRIQHVVEVPIVSEEHVIGTLHFAESDPDRSFTPAQITLAEAVASVIADTLERLRREDRLEREREELRTALELTATPVVTSDPELRMNAAARRLLGEVVDAEEHLHRLLARHADDGTFSRRIEVTLEHGTTATLHAASTHVQRALVSVLELKRDAPGIPPSALAPLTPREADVAVLLAEGLTDREIAEKLFLSHHTVGQHVKRIYRRLDVDSRVALTRHLLGAAQVSTPASLATART